MLRAVLYFKSGEWVELGVSARDQILGCLIPDENGDYDSVVDITEEFIGKIDRLKKEDFSYLPESMNFLPRVQKIIREHIGTKMYMSPECTHSKKGTRFTELINEDKGFYVALRQVNKEFNDD